jgi:hypothetical protein
MSDAPASAPDPAPARPATESRAGRLLALIRKLIDYGRELTATLQRDPATCPRRVGTTDVAVILARIARGLHLARALEERLVRNAARLDASPRPRRAASTRAPRTTVPAAPRARDSAPPDAGLPTPEQIGRRPIGAVLADICRDLDILPSHPLWRELSRAIAKEGGNLAALLKDIIRQAAQAVGQAWIAAGLPPGPLPPSPAPAGTGPP